MSTSPPPPILPFPSLLPSLVSPESTTLQQTREVFTILTLHHRSPNIHLFSLALSLLLCLRDPPPKAGCQEDRVRPLYLSRVLSCHFSSTGWANGGLNACTHKKSTTHTRVCKLSQPAAWVRGITQTRTKQRDLPVQIHWGLSQSGLSIAQMSNWGSLH